MRHKNIRVVLGIVLLFSCVGVSSGAEGPLAAAVRQAIKDNPVPRARVGVAICRLSDGRDVFDVCANELFGMASNTKLFTTAAVLWNLDPTYDFRTAIIANGKVEGGVLEGDLVVVGGGDPNISARLNGDPLYVPNQMALAVRKFGICEITGDLVMDDRLFDREYCAPGWPAAESLWWYVAPVSALSFNDNCLDITIVGVSKGKPAVVKVAPDVPYARVINTCTTVGPRDREGVTFERGQDGTIVVGGRIRTGSSRMESITVANPALFLASALRLELGRCNVTLRGKDRLVETGEMARPEAREIFVLRSNLAETVKITNRRSQNLYAEHLLKILGAEQTGIGSFKSGLVGVGDFLKAVNIPAESFHVNDGCGLSPGNQATPAAIIALLRTMYGSNMRGVYFDSLAVSGDETTTLRARMNDAQMRGRVHAKTGTIQSRGISAFSGYAVARNGEVYAFAILSNGFKSANLQKARAMEDAVCRALVCAP